MATMTTVDQIPAYLERSKVRARSHLLNREFDAFRRRLTAMRKDRNLRQADVAELLGVTPQAVQKFERYDSDPKLSTLLRYANAVGATVTISVTEDSGQSSDTPTESAWHDITPLHAKTQRIWDAAQGRRSATLSGTEANFDQFETTIASMFAFDSRISGITQWHPTGISEKSVHNAISSH